ncbi:hypothetical protein KJ671_04200, partial [Patescibacteria group bacterium]|nr:hypothetical protein [Patescibacteria group bacterium]
MIMMNLRIKTLLMISLILISSLLSGCSLLRGIIPSLPNKGASPVHNLTKNSYYNTIQAALDDADNDNIIEVADGTYDESIAFPSYNKVVLKSVNGPSSTIIRGDGGSPTVTFINGPLEDSTLEGFTITHINGLIGKGIWNYRSNLSINNCIISNNYFDYPAATFGGGIGNEGTLTITGSTISGNYAPYGGGIENFGPLTITGSTISGNSAVCGGGIYLGSYSENITIGGDSADDKNTICGNYKTEQDPSLDQQIRDESGSLYEIYKDTNYISASCSIEDQPPIIEIISPSDGETISGTVRFSTYATDDYALDKVEFYIDDELKRTYDLSYDYENYPIVGSTCMWDCDTTSDSIDYIPNGSHIFKAKAYDTAGQIAVDNISFIVDNIAGAPSIEIEVTKWGITNLWESSTLHRFLNEVASASGYSIDCIIDVYVANDDPIWLVEIKLSTGEVIALSKKAPGGHYSIHLQRYMFSRDRYLNYLS